MYVSVVSSQCCCYNNQNCDQLGNWIEESFWNFHTWYLLCLKVLILFSSNFFLTLRAYLDVHVGIPYRKWILGPSILHLLKSCQSPNLWACWDVVREKDPWRVFFFFFLPLGLRLGGVGLIWVMHKWTSYPTNVIENLAQILLDSLKRS